MDVKRYDTDSEFHGMEECDRGRYVRHTDHIALQASIKVLAEKLRKEASHHTISAIRYKEDFDFESENVCLCETAKLTYCADELMGLLK